MSSNVEGLEEVVPAALKLNDEDERSEKRSRSSVQKRLDLENIAKKNSQAERNSLEDANGVKLNNINNYNRNSTTPSFDLPIEDREHNTSLAEERHDDRMQQLLGISGSDDPKLDKKEKSADCADECMCKIKQGLGLIVDEIIKVDTAINNLPAKGQCPYIPKPDDKKEFAKSVQKNSSVCHVIIGELKKQRAEIDEMLELYEESTRDFSKMEATLNRQREKMEQIEAVLTSITDTVSNVRQDIAKRQQNFQLEMKSRRSRVETREEILSVFLNWLSSLEAKRYEEREESDLRLKEATEERDKDRTMLTLAVRQLQEVRKIEILLMTQRVAMAQGGEDRLNVPTVGTQKAKVPASSCGCSPPINRVAVISGQCAEETRGCGTLRGKPGRAFNNTMMRCAGGADGFGTAMTFATGLRDNENRVWDSRTPFGYQKIVRAPMIYRRVPIGLRTSPTNNSRRQRRKMRNVSLIHEH